jgi:hypothetical protein
MKSKVLHSLHSTDEANEATSNNHQQIKNHLKNSTGETNTHSSHTLISESKQNETKTTKQNHRSKRKATSKEKTLTLLDILGRRQVLNFYKLRYLKCTHKHFSKHPRMIRSLSR